MFDTKIEVDKHVDSCLKKINNETERNLRSIAFAKLYFKVGDLEQARRYITCYLAAKPLSTEGLNLLAKTLEKQGKHELAVEAYRKSLDIDSKQNGLVIKICELLASDEVGLDLSGARYYCEKAQSFDPHNPIVFSLKERLVAAESKNPDDVSELLLAELVSRPTDINLRVRLLHHLLQYHRVNEAYKHVCDIEQKQLQIFANSLSWYEAVAEVLIHYQRNNLVNTNLTWEFWILMVSVFDKLVALTLVEYSDHLKSISDCVEVLFNFDQTLATAMEYISSCNEKPLVQEFINHYKAQLCFHFVTYLLKRYKRDYIKHKEAMHYGLPLLFASYHAKPAELRSMWLDNSSEVRRQQIQRWHREAAYRCSQTGHLLLAIAKNRKLTVIEKALQSTSGLWRKELFNSLFVTRDLRLKSDSSYFVSCSNLIEITIRLPEMSDIVKYDEVAELLYPDSLHHFIWLCLHQKLPTFRCTVFEGLQYSIKNLNNCAAESLNLLDIESFLYCASLCAQQVAEKRGQADLGGDKPNMLPASVTDLLGTASHAKWLQAAYKMYRNEYGAELSELRLNLIRGIEVVRCVGNHGLDVKLLIILATTFAERAKHCTKQSEIEFNDARAELYWKAALPILEKLEKKQAVSYGSNRLFDYKSKEMTQSEVASCVDDGKLFTAVQFMKKKDYEKALNLFESIKSPYASFHQAHIYRTMANDQMAQHKESVTSEMRSQHVILLSRARDYLYLTVDRLRDPLVDRKHPLNNCLGSEIEKVERLLSRFDSDSYNRNDIDGMSDENISSAGSMGDHLNNSYFSNVGNSFHYNEPVTPIYESRNIISNRLRFDSARREARPSPERLDAQLRQMQASRDATINQVLDQNRLMVESHRSLVEELRGFKDAVTHLTSTVEDLKTVKNTVNEELKSIKDSVSELKSSVDAFNFTDVSDLIQEMRREILDLKKDKSKHSRLSEEDLYALDDEYGAEYNFNPSNLYPNLTGRLPTTSVTFPPTLYPSLYPMYPYAGLGLPQGGTIPYGQEAQLNDLRVLNSISQGIPQPNYVQPSLPAGIAQVKPMWEGISQESSLGALPSTLNLTRPQATSIFKQPDTTITSVSVAPIVFPSIGATQSTSTISMTSIKAPVNVVITSSDPLPTTSVQTTQILSVTIPPQHLKGKNSMKKQPHDYQITLPTTAITTATATPAIMNQPSPVVATEGLLPNVAPPIYSAIKSPSTELGLHIEKRLSQSFGSSNNKDENSFNKSNASRSSIDEHDPCPDFKPVVPLPDEVALTTGEEGENVVFCERAKLFRYANKEWRERGVGNLKILKNVESGKIRLLMRRDQVHKICANHYITKDLVLTPMPNNNRAYVWAANDFADGTMVLEKLCVRFKMEEQATLFAAAFENAKLYSSNASFNEQSFDKQNNPLPIQLEQTAKTNVSTASEKSNSLGGFIFTSTPTFKTLEPVVTPKATSPQEIHKSSPFATFTFGTISTTNRTNIFTNTNKTTTETTTPEKAITLLAPKSPKTPDEFTPTAEFTPVVTLPNVVDLKTGEENAKVLFEGRAKLLRYEVLTKEWKERGTGNIKLLQQNNTIRLLMRREHIHKVCCNHQLQKQTLFTRMATNPKALTWSAQDYSENVFKSEIFSIRFKTEEQTDAFATALTIAQSSLDDNNNVCDENTERDLDHKEDKKIKGEPKVESPKVVTGWGDKFKPKPGHWKCKNCYVENEGRVHLCVACETPNPNITPRKGIDSSSMSGAQFSFGLLAGVTPTENKSQFSFGSTTPSTGFLFGTKSVPATTLPWGDAFKPKEGSWECSQCLVRNDADKSQCVSCEYPKESTKTTATFETPGLQFNFGLAIKEKPSTDSAISWGDKFKPKQGSWECTECYTRNDVEKLYCISCEAPKDDTIPKKDKGIDFTTSTLGFPFKFGIPPTSAESLSTFTFPSKPSTLDISQPIPAAPTKTFSFGSDTNKTEESSSQFVFGSPQQHAFEFIPRSPRRHSSGCQGDEESDNYVEDEGEHIYFKPVIPLPDKVEVKSGEEDETVLYCHRAKLYRFVQGEWKERGIGDIKILLRTETGKLRVLMRREQVLKICLNHNLTPEIEYLPKGEKAWLFSAPDYSEGELNRWQFCIRFKSSEVAQEFKKAVESALQKPKTDSDPIKPTSSNNDSDVEFISETKVSPEEEEEALKLKLPKNFMAYRQLPDCTCETCKNEDLLFSGIGVPKESPANSVFGTTQPLAKSETLKSILAKPSLFTNTVLRQPATSSTDNKVSFNSFSFTLKTDAQNTTTTTKPIVRQSTFETSNTPLKSSTAISSMVTTGSLFSNPTTVTSTSSIFGGSTFGLLNKGSLTTSLPSTTPTTGKVFGTTANTSSIQLFGTTPSPITPTLFGGGSTTPVDFRSLSTNANTPKQDEIVLKCDSDLSFASIAANTSNAFDVPSQDNVTPFAGLGAGAPVFASLKRNQQRSKTDKHKSDNQSGDEGDGDDSNEAEDHDPHFEPVIPLPEVVAVSTGEEEEIAIFNERGKVYRYDNQSKEWKERGVGQLKILHHPLNGTYRFLLRREQVHKVVLNMLITANLDLQPMSTSDKAWLWCGHNHVEGTTSLEKLAARFKSCDIAKHFYNAAMEAISELKEKQEASLPSTVQNFEEVLVSGHQDESAEDEEDDGDDDDRSIMFAKNCIFSEELSPGEWKEVCSGTLQLFYDPEINASRVCIFNDIGEVVSSSIVGMTTEIEVQDNSCVWRAVEWCTDGNTPEWRNLKTTFDDPQITEAFHCSFLESIQIAHESELVDGIFMGSKDSDDEQ